MHVGFARRIQGQCRCLRAIQQAAVQACVGMDDYRLMGTVWRSHQPQHALLFNIAEGFLFVARRDAGHVGLDPDLQEMRGVVGRMVELAVLHTPPGAHALHIARRNALDVAHAVLVRQVAGQHIADDFHVAVAMCAKAGTGCNAIFVDDAQVSPTHVFRVVITAK